MDLGSAPSEWVQGGLPERYQTAVREVSSTVRVVPSYQATVVSAQAVWGWSRRALSEGPARTFERRATVLSGLTGWRRCVESGVQAQTGDQGDGFPEGLAAMEQVQHGVTVVAHQHQWALRQPAAQLQYHLPGPVGELFVPESLLAGW